MVELPSNWVMKRVKPNVSSLKYLRYFNSQRLVHSQRWIPLLVILWGGVTTLTCLVHSFGGLVAIRMCLGLCEGGLLPGIASFVIMFLFKNS
jgi:MFS family permease